MISHCDEARGTLPWLLNGTLSDEERRRVLQHLATCETCRKDLADTRMAAEIFDQHPPAEAILDLAWDETPGGVDPALLEEHLAACPRCAAELELARMSRRLEEDDRIVPLTRRTTPAPAPVVAPAPSRSGWRGWKSAALAAGLGGVVALGGWLQTAGRVNTLEEQLANQTAVSVPAPPAATGESKQVQQLAAEVAERQRKIEQLETALNEVQQQATELSGQVDQLARSRPAAPVPQINSWVETLLPGADVARSNEPAAPKEVPGSSYAVLLLASAHEETHRGHDVEIVDAAGKVVWSAAGLVRDEYGNYILNLPPGALRAGGYTIRVYGPAGGQREPLESYSIRVQ